MKYLLVLVVFALLTSSCGPRRSNEKPVLPPGAETVSFSGQPLYAKPADSVARAKSDNLITTIRGKGALSEDDYVAIGRSLVGIGQFRNAVNAYTEGLGAFPKSYKLRRHRGHRYINLRELDNAIADLTQAEELIRHEPEVFEVDAAGNPGASYLHQIWYHIGLYHFMKRNYAEAAAAFEKSLATSHAGSDSAGASDWLYNSYMRAGEQEKASAVAKPFTLDFNIDNKAYPYYRRLLLFNGVIKPEELVDEAKDIAAMDLFEVTKLYGLANYYAYQGDTAHAQTLYSKILQSGEWPGFAYACAELDVRK